MLDAGEGLASRVDGRAIAPTAVALRKGSGVGAGAMIRYPDPALLVRSAGTACPIAVLAVHLKVR